MAQSPTETDPLFPGDSSSGQRWQNQFPLLITPPTIPGTPIETDAEDTELEAIPPGYQADEVDDVRMIIPAATPAAIQNNPNLHFLAYVMENIAGQNPNSFFSANCFIALQIHNSELAIVYWHGALYLVSGGLGAISSIVFKGPAAKNPANIVAKYYNITGSVTINAVLNTYFTQELFEPGVKRTIELFKKPDDFSRARTHLKERNRGKCSGFTIDLAKSSVYFIIGGTAATTVFLMSIQESDLPLWLNIISTVDFAFQNVLGTRSIFQKGWRAGVFVKSKIHRCLSTQAAARQDLDNDLFLLRMARADTLQSSLEEILYLLQNKEQSEQIQQLLDLAWKTNKTPTESLFYELFILEFANLLQSNSPKAVTYSLYLLSVIGTILSLGNYDCESVSGMGTLLAENATAVTETTIAVAASMADQLATTVTENATAVQATCFTMVNENPLAFWLAVGTIIPLNVLSIDVSVDVTGEAIKLIVNIIRRLQRSRAPWTAIAENWSDRTSFGNFLWECSRSVANTMVQLPLAAIQHPKALLIPQYILTALVFGSLKPSLNMNHSHFPEAYWPLLDACTYIWGFAFNAVAIPYVLKVASDSMVICCGKQRHKQQLKVEQDVHTDVEWYRNKITNRMYLFALHNLVEGDLSRFNQDHLDTLVRNIFGDNIPTFTTQDGAIVPANVIDVIIYLLHGKRWPRDIYGNHHLYADRSWCYTIQRLHERQVGMDAANQRPSSSGYCFRWMRRNTTQVTADVEIPPVFEEHRETQQQEGRPTEVPDDFELVPLTSTAGETDETFFLIGPERPPSDDEYVYTVPGFSLNHDGETGWE